MQYFKSWKMYKTILSLKVSFKQNEQHILELHLSMVLWELQLVRPPVFLSVPTHVSPANAADAK